MSFAARTETLGRACKVAALETRTKLLPLTARHRVALTFVIRHDVHAQCVNFATSMVDISNLTVGGRHRWGVLAAPPDASAGSWPQAVCYGLGRFSMSPTRPLTPNPLAPIVTSFNLGYGHCHLSHHNT